MTPSELRNRLLDNAARLRTARDRNNAVEVAYLEAEQDELFDQRTQHITARAQARTQHSTRTTQPSPQPTEH